MIRNFIAILFWFSSVAYALPQDVTPGSLTPGFYSTKNYVKNGSCFANKENITPTTGANLTRSTTTPLFGSAHCGLDSSASAETFKWTSSTFEPGTYGGNCEARFIYSGDASLYKFYVLSGATKVSQDITLLNVGTTAVVASATFPCGDGSTVIYPTIESTSSSAAAIKVTGVYAGLTTNIAVVRNPPTVQIFTSGSGTYTKPASVRWIKVIFAGGGGGGSGAGGGGGATGTATTFGSSLLTANPGVGASSGSGTAGAGGTVTINSPAITVKALTGARGDAAGFTADTQGGSGGATPLGGAGAGGNRGASGYAGVANTGSGGGGGGGTAAIASQAGGGAAGYGEAIITNPASSYSYSVGPGGAGGLTGSTVGGDGGSGVIIVEEYSEQYAVRTDQTNYDWTAYTPTFTGFGTVAGSNHCLHKRDGSDLLLRCRFVSGTSTATEARLSLPGSLVSSSSRIQTLETAGSYVLSATAVDKGGVVLVEPNVAYVTFSDKATFGATSATGLAKANGSAVGTSGAATSLNARIPIEGWTETQNAPILVGSVTSGTLGAERVERLSVTNSGVPAIGSQSGTWVSSITDNGVGSMTVNIVAGTFSAAPACNGTAVQGSTRITSITTSAIAISTVGNGGSAADLDLSLLCMGPR